MTLRRTAGYFELTFDPPDWENPAGGAKEFIVALKNEIACAAMNKGVGWSYSPETKIWTIPDTALNEELLNNYRDKFLPIDPRQGTLWDAT